jgi:hypothetical protein
VGRCAVWMQGEELAERREVGAKAIENIFPRQHQLVLVEKGILMKSDRWNVNLAYPRGASIEVPAISGNC